MKTTRKPIDFAVPCHDSTLVWFPVTFSGNDATGDPASDHDIEGNSLVFGRVDASYRSYGCSRTCYRNYSSRKAARAAAVRLVRKLQAAKSAEEHNAIVKAWFDRT